MSLSIQVIVITIHSWNQHTVHALVSFVLVLLLMYVIHIPLG